MTDLAEYCRKSRSDGRKLLSIYLTVGFPRPDWTVPLACAIFDGGADLIELGIPFSDPLADGPTIQKASMTAIAGGVTRADVFRAASALNGTGRVLLMGYLNSVLAEGADRFLSQCREHKIYGLIIPDLPLDEEPDLWEHSRRNGLPIIPFVSPTTPPERMKQIDEIAAPFVYAVSLTGITGARKELGEEVSRYLDGVRQAMKTPILVGFGVSNGEMAKRMAQHADGVIVGSAIIERIERADTLNDAVHEVRTFVRELRQALDDVHE